MNTWMLMTFMGIFGLVSSSMLLKKDERKRVNSNS
jgi:hypothetical protein